MIKNIIFDVGNVLMDYDSEAYMIRLGFDADTRAAIQAAMFGNPLWNETDRGVMTDEELEEGFVKNAPSKYEDAVRLAYRRASETISLLPYAVDWVKSLKERGYHLYVLSNYSRKIYEETKDQMKFLPYIDYAVFSYQCRLIKPDPAIYRHLLNTCGLDPRETVFIDDRPENVGAAEGEGIHGIVFSSKEQAQNDLERLLKK